MVGIVTFYDAVGRTSNMIFDDPGITSLEDVEQVMMVMSAWSNCGVKGFGLIQPGEVSPPRTPSDGPYNTTENKAILTFRDTTADSLRKARVVYRLPGPGEGVFERVKEKGLRVVPAVGETIAAGLNGVFERELEFVKGKHWAKPHKH